MKLIKEHINDKFEEESDSIHDLEIGFFRIHHFNSFHGLAKQVLKKEK